MHESAGQKMTAAFNFDNGRRPMKTMFVLAGLATLMAAPSVQADSCRSSHPNSEGKSRRQS